MSSVKEFLKPNWWKIAITLFFSILIIQIPDLISSVYPYIRGDSKLGVLLQIITWSFPAFPLLLVDFLLENWLYYTVGFRGCFANCDSPVLFPFGVILEAYLVSCAIYSLSLKHKHLSPDAMKRRSGPRVAR